MANHQLGPVVRCIRNMGAAQHAKDQTDEELLRAFSAQNDQAAFTALVKRHGPLVMGVCHRVAHHFQDAEDAFQATFLLLACKAASIRKKESLGSWLHGVAYRMSRDAKRAASRRRRHEWQVNPSSQPGPAAEAAWREMQGILDEEIGRLPEIYRQGFILCCLENKGRAEVARQLGVKEATVWSRLAQARKLLQQRLGRRGVSLTALLGVLALSENTGRAAVSSGLVSSTVNGALAFAAGDAPAACIVSAQVAALVKGGLKTMLVTKAKIAAALLLTLGIAAGAGLALYQAPTAQEPQEEKSKAVGKTQEVRQQEALAPVRLDQFGDPLPTEAIARIGTVRFRHGNLIQFLTFSPDGKQLISQSDVVRVWETATGKELGHFTPLPVHPWPGNSIGAGSLSPDGKLLAVGASNPVDRIALFELATGRKLKEFGEGQYELVTFSPNGETLAAIASRRGRVELWDIATGQRLHAWDAHGQAYAVAFARDGKTLLTNGRDKRVCFWDVATGRQTAEIKDCPTVWNFSFPACQTALAPDGTLLAAIRPMEDNETMSINQIGIWNVATGKELRRLTGPKQEVPPDYWQGFRALAFAPDGKLVTSGPDSNIRIWDPATGRELRQVPAGFAASISFALSPDGKRVAGGAETIRVIDLTDPRPQPVAPPIYQLLAAPEVALNGELAVTAHGNVAVWNAATGKQLHLLERQIAAVHLSPDARTLFTSYGKTVGAWNTATGQELHTFDVKQVAVGTSWLALNPDGKLLLAEPGSDGAIDVLNALTGKAVRSFKGPDSWPDSYIYALAFGPEAQSLVACFADRTMAVWDVATGKKLRQFSLPEDEKGAVGTIPVGKPVFTASLSPDGKLLAFGSQGRFLVLKDTVTGQDIRRLDKLPDGVCLLAFSPDGKTLAWAGWKDPTIHLVEVLTGRERRILSGHGGRVLKLAFSGDGKRLISSSTDTTALIWDLSGNLGTKGRSLTPQDLDTCWAHLAGDDATRAFQAIRRLAASPTEAIPYFREHLKPVPAVNEQRLARLIADLDNNQFAVRESATKELEKLGEIAAPACRKVLKQKPAAEARRRLEALLEKQSRERLNPSSERLRTLRAVEVLEHIGTPGARQVLETLAKGAPEARVTQEAQASLDCLAKRPSAD